MTRRPLTTLFIIIALLILLVMSVSLVHDLFTSRIAGANDFLPRWKGTVLFFQEGINPYSTEATEQIQMHMYGRLARPDEDQVAFAYPFYTIFFVAPLAFFNLSYAMASAIWLVLILIAIYLGMAISMKVTRLQMPLWLYIFTILCLTLSYNSVRTIVLGQFAGLVFLLSAGSLLALRGGQDRLAGVFLALSTVKPQMSLFLVLALIIWGIVQHRQRFVIFFFVTLGLLVTCSLLLLPNWPAEFLSQVTQYTGYTELGSPVWIITRYYWPHLGQAAEIALSVLILILLLYLWFRLNRINSYGESLLAVAMITLPLAELIVTRTATTNQIILYLPIMWILGRATARKTLKHQYVAVFLILTVIMGWLLFLNTRVGRWENPVMFLYLPAITILLIIWDWIVMARMNLPEEVNSDALPG